MQTVTKLLGATILAGALSLGAAQISSAHHSAAPHFDISVDIEKTGIVTEWKFINPHAYIYFDVTNDDGSVTNWRCEGLPAASMMRMNFSDETFVPGMEITIFGNPARREDNACLMRSFAFADGIPVSFEDVLPDNLVRGEILDTTSASTEHEKFLPDGTPNFAGFWMSNRAGARRAGPQAGDQNGAMGPPPEGGGMGGAMGRPPGGGLSVELTAAGQAANDAYVQIYDDPGITCGIANIIFGMGHNQNVNKITQDKDKITLTYGYMDYLRTIYLDDRDFPNDITSSEGGYSIGEFDSDALVVTTKGMAGGMIHPLAGGTFSEAAQIVERMSYDAESNAITRDYVMTDPDYIVGEYTGSDTYVKSAQPYSPYNCEVTTDIGVLRPGLPEHAAELQRIETQEAASVSGAAGSMQNAAMSAKDIPASISESSGVPRWLLALGGLLIALGGFALLRARKNT